MGIELRLGLCSFGMEAVTFLSCPGHLPSLILIIFITK